MIRKIVIAPFLRLRAARNCLLRRLASRKATLLTFGTVYDANAAIALARQGRADRSANIGTCHVCPYEEGQTKTKVMDYRTNDIMFTRPLTGCSFAVGVARHDDGTISKIHAVHTNSCDVVYSPTEHPAMHAQQDEQCLHMLGGVEHPDIIILRPSEYNKYSLSPTSVVIDCVNDRCVRIYTTNKFGMTIYDNSGDLGGWTMVPSACSTATDVAIAARHQLTTQAQSGARDAFS